MVDQRFVGNDSAFGRVVRRQKVGQQTTRRRTVGMVVLHGQTIRDVRLREKMKSCDAEAVEPGFVFDAANSRKRRKEGLVGTLGSGTGTFPEFSVPRFLSSGHHHSQRLVDFFVTSVQMVDQLLRR